MILKNLLLFDVDDFLEVDDAHKLTAFPLEHHPRSSPCGWQWSPHERAGGLDLLSVGRCILSFLSSKPLRDYDTTKKI
jgi:hypothetical protein